MFFLPYIIFNDNINDTEIMPLKVHHFLWGKRAVGLLTFGEKDINPLTFQKRHITIFLLIN